MQATELKESLTRKIETAYVIAGEDSYLRDSALQELKGLAGDDMTEFNLSIMDGGAVSFLDVLSAFSQVPFMAERRVSVVKDWNPSLTDGEIKRLKDELSGDSESVLVFTYSGTPNQTIKKLATFVDCSKLDKNAVADFIENECKKSGVKITTPAVTKLVTYTSCDLAKVKNELKKLFSYCGDTGEIGEIAVDSVVSRDMEFVIFALSNAVAQKNAVEAYEVLEGAKGDSGKNLGMLTTLTTQFRRMLHVLLNKNADKKTLAGYLGISEYAVSRTLALAQKFNQARLKSIVDRLEELEYEFKNGKVATADQALFIGVTYALQTK